jgi:hypothetical protein
MTTSENTGFQIKDFLAKIPRPNIGELIDLYNKLDKMVVRVAEILTTLRQPLYDSTNGVLSFGGMTEEELLSLVKKNPNVLVPFFTTICGLSIREFERLYGIKDVYSMQTRFIPSGEKEKKFIKAIKDLLPPQIHVETVLYKFYKNWEEHQKRHERGRSFEEEVRKFFRKHSYDCEKITSPTEVDAAIPSRDPAVVMPIRIGVSRDLVKRAKEFGSEFIEIRKYFPKAKFVVVFGIPRHESSQRDLIRKKIKEYGPVKGYDAIVFDDELENLLPKLEQWNVPKKSK